MPASARKTSTDAPRFDLADWMPVPGTWKWVAGGLAAGLLLFLLVTLRERGDVVPGANDTAPPTAAAPRFSPLPSPLPADDDAGRMGGLPAQVDDDGDRPTLVETAPAPPPPPPVEAPLPATVEEAPPPVATSEPRPIPGQTPPPTYPATSLRRGETGTVLVSATIGVDGRPRDLGVSRSSGSRRLDRAALDAVRDWRFEPAMSNGQPVEATVNVPIEFRR